MTRSEVAAIDNEHDLVCVGGGLGGLAAAASASARGLSCLVLEASEFVGGCGAYSGGLLWAPVGDLDSIDDADTYLAHVQGERRGDDPLRRRVLSAVMEAFDEHRRLGIDLEAVPGNPDAFHPAPGSRASGRMWEVAFDGSRLGHMRPLLSPSPHYRIGLRHRELYGGASDSGLAAADVEPLLVRRQADDLLTMGPGLAAAYLHAAAVTGSADVETGARVTGLVTDSDGRVTGVRLMDGRIAIARLGVLLATGGYGWASDAADLEGLPDLVEAGPPTTRGDHLAFAGEVGAEVARGGGPQFALGARVRPDVHPGTDVPLHSQLFDVLGLPHTLVVNRAGRRFGDESYYVGINAALGRWSMEEKQWENVPCWLIVDEQFRRRYPLATVPAGVDYPPTVTSADDPRTLAEILGVDAAGLVATLARFNHHAAVGEDPDFGRGSRAFVRRRYGDPQHGPNANLGPVSEPPFHALPLRLLGTGMCSFGLRTDADARVLRRGGAAVPVLYATGNAAATSEFRGYITGYANSRNVAMARRAVAHLSDSSGRNPRPGYPEKEGTPA